MRINTGLLDPEIKVVEVYRTKGRDFETLAGALGHRENLVEEFIRKLPGCREISPRGHIKFIQYILDNRLALLNLLDYPDEKPERVPDVTLIRDESYHDPSNAIVRSAIYKTKGQRFDSLKQAIEYRRGLVLRFFQESPEFQSISPKGHIAFMKAILNDRGTLIGLLNYSDMAERDWDDD